MDSGSIILNVSTSDWINYDLYVMLLNKEFYIEFDETDQGNNKN